jgi:acyl carrier protein
MSSLENEVKQLIIDALNLEDMTIDDIDSHEALFVEGLGLDSIDALELGVTMKNKYNITINSEDDTTNKHFESVATLAVFIEQNKGE